MENTRVINSVEKFMRKGNVNAAIDQYLEILKHKPTDVTTINALGDLYLRAGKTEEAIRCFSSIADIHFDNGFPHLAIVMLKKALKLSPNHTEMKKKIAFLYSKQGNPAEANRIYLEIAQLFERIGNVQDALEYYEKAASCDATNANLQLTIGQLYIGKGMPEHALQAFHKAGSIFVAAGDNEQANSVYTKILYLAPDNLKALQAIMSIYEAKQQPEGAIGWLTKGLEKSPTDKDLLLLASRYYLSIGKTNDAEKSLLAIADKRPEHFEHRLAVSEQLLNEGELRRTVDCLQSGLDKITNHDHLQRAAACLHGILESDKAQLSALTALEQTYKKLGDNEKRMATLNTLFEAAAVNNDELLVSQTMEEISLLLMENSAKTYRTQKPTPARQIQIEVDDAFQLPGILPEPSPFILSPGAAASPYNRTGNGVARYRHDSALRIKTPSSLAQNTITCLSPAELHATVEKMLHSLNEMLNLNYLNADEEKELLLQRSYFQAMQAFSMLLLNPLPSPVGVMNAASANALLSSPIAAQVFAAIEPATDKPVAAIELSGEPMIVPATNNLSAYPANRRRVERSDLKIPVQVSFKDGRAPEATESLNISKLGIRFKVRSSVAVGMALRLDMVMPAAYRLYERDGDSYAIEAVICQVNTGIGSELFVGAEFGSLL